MRTMLIIALALMIGVLAIGMAVRWDALNLLELGDRLWPGAAGKRVGEALPYGRDPMQQVDVFAPQGHGRTDAPLPVLIWFNGGGWASGTRPQYGFAGRALSADGFVAVVAGYRHAPTHHFPAFTEDTRDAILWVRANIARYGGDPDRIVLVGQSAGAHMAVLTVLDRRWLGALGDDGGPIRGIVGLSGPYDFAPFEPGGMAERALGDAPNIADTQPINFARGDAPPMLFITGDADRTVRPRNSRVMAAAITDAGGTARVIEYAGIAHRETAMALSLPFRGMAPVVRDTLAFAREVTSPSEVR